MSSRPRRSAAQRASVAITDMADRDNMSSSRSRRTGDGLASVSRGQQGGKDHTYLTVKMPASKLRQATNSKEGSSIAVNSDTAPKRSTRGGKKSYVVESDSDEEEEEGEDEIQVGAPAVAGDEDEDEEMDDAEDDDAEEDDADGEDVEDDMDMDAEGEEDEDPEADMSDVAPPAPAPIIKISKATKESPESKRNRKPFQKIGVQFSAPNDSDDDELSELELEDELTMGSDDDAEGEEDEEDEEDMDAEGDEIEEDQEAEAEPKPGAEAAPGPEDLGSDEDGVNSRGGTPDLTRMTVRQRARFEEVDSSHYQALSNEVQAKKHFTAEEKAMRRAEMARRRRNLSEKRNEEVKQETINKLLKKQATKTNRKNLQSIGEEGVDSDGVWRPSPVFIRWVSSKQGERIAVPEDMLSGPAGRLFAKTARPSGAAAPTGLAQPRKMVEEVS